MNLDQFKHTCLVEDAAKLREWVAHRGGVAVWRSINLSNPGKSWSTPANQKDGNPTVKPTWESGDAPTFIVTDPALIGVVTDQEVKRFHVAIRPGSQNFLGTPLMWKCTDKASARIRRELERAGKGSRYEFDYGTQECVILAPISVVPLSHWRPA